MKRAFIAILISFIEVAFFGCAAKNIFYAQVDPAKPIVLPKDHASHPEFRTEWWYFVGHLESDDGKKFGFELVFFRQRTETAKWHGFPVRSMANPLYMSHFAITDLEQDKFVYDIRLGREKDFTGYASTDFLYLKTDTWRAQGAWPDIHIFAETKRDGCYVLELVLTPKKPAVIHGESGISKKSIEGKSSYYISFTRLSARGMLIRDGVPMRVKGIAWHDHEIMSTGLGDTLKGWKWFAVQLNNNVEIMMFYVYRADGSVDPTSSATIVLPDGSYEHMYADSFSIEDIDFWYSKKSEAKYPIKWRLKIPKYNADLTVWALKNEQELIFWWVGLEYWEGKCAVSGKYQDAQVFGDAYVEMTGYGKRKIRL